MEKKVIQALKTVIDPELGVNIVDLGFIYKVKVKEDKAEILMTLTSPGCPLSYVINDLIQKSVRKIKGINKVKINLTFDPTWTPERIDPQIRKQLGI